MLAATAENACDMRYQLRKLEHAKKVANSLKKEIPPFPDVGEDVQDSKRVFLLDPCRIRTDDRQMPTKRGCKPDDRSLLCYHCTKGPVHVWLFRQTTVLCREARPGSTLMASRYSQSVSFDVYWLSGVVFSHREGS